MRTRAPHARSRARSVFAALAAALSCGAMAFSQGLDQAGFLSFDTLKTWTAVAVDWQAAPTVYVYDADVYQGHADFVRRGLHREVTFAAFKAGVRHAADRRYLPFFLFDLRESPWVMAGKEHNWAVRLEDYEYDDNAAEHGGHAVETARDDPPIGSLVVSRGSCYPRQKETSGLTTTSLCWRT